MTRDPPHRDDNRFLRDIPEHEFGNVPLQPKERLIALLAAAVLIAFIPVCVWLASGMPGLRS